MTVPIYLKNDANMPRPHDRQYYLVTGNGMFVCRNEEFWESDVPSSRTPRGLAGHRACCKVRFPKLGTAALEYVVAFFEQVYRVWGGRINRALALGHAPPAIPALRAPAGSHGLAVHVRPPHGAGCCLQGADAAARRASADRRHPLPLRLRGGQFEQRPPGRGPSRTGFT